jgi:hypothetical protein
MVEPVITTVSGAWTLATTMGELSKKLYEFGKNLKDRAARQKVEEMLDALNDLKQRAAVLEDENRELREQLRFKTDEFEFRSPFWTRRCTLKGHFAQSALPTGRPRRSLKNPCYGGF